MYSVGMAKTVKGVGRREEEIKRKGGGEWVHLELEREKVVLEGRG